MTTPKTFSFFIQEYTLKGVVNAAYGQLTESREHLKIAQQYFQVKRVNVLC